MKIVVDTSVIIDYLRSRSGILTLLVNNNKEGRLDLYMPTVVITELWAGKDSKDELKTSKLEKVIKIFKIIDLNSNIAKTTGILLRDRISSGFDAIVAATALEIGAQVATSNIKHFSKIKNLKLYSKS